VIEQSTNSTQDDIEIKSTRNTTDLGTMQTIYLLTYLQL